MLFQVFAAVLLVVSIIEDKILIPIPECLPHHIQFAHDFATYPDKVLRHVSFPGSHLSPPPLLLPVVSLAKHDQFVGTVE